jgi:hypothetical protein
MKPNLVQILLNKGNNNSEQSYKGKVKTHKYINRQNQSTTGKLKTVMTLIPFQNSVPSPQQLYNDPIWPPQLIMQLFVSQHYLKFLISDLSNIFKSYLTFIVSDLCPLNQV